MRFGLAVSAGVTLILLAAHPSAADNSVLTVNLAEHTVDPANPTLNIRASDSVFINMKGDIPSLPDGKIYSVIDLPRYKKGLNSKLDPEIDPSKAGFATFGRQVTVTFRECSDAEIKAEGIERPSSNCGFAVLRDELKASWVVFAETETITFSIRGLESDYSYSFPIVLQKKPFALTFSAGFAILGVRDNRYRLDPITGDTQKSKLVQVSDGSYPYKLSAFANYMWLRHPTLGFSVGVATDVPVDKITTMAGISIALRTLPVNSTGYITIGGSYAQRQRLRPEFEGGCTVASNLTSDALLEDRYGFGAFVALSFSFLGGEDQFKGVFAGPPKK